MDMIVYNYSDSGNSQPNEIMVDEFRDVGITLNAERIDYTEFNSQWVGVSYLDAADGWLSVGFTRDNFFFNSAGRG